MFSFKKGNNLTNFKNLISNLEEMISNTSIFQDILERLHQAEKEGTISQINDCGITILDKINRYTYNLDIKNSEIKIEYTSLDNNYQEGTTISFANDTIIVIEKKVTTISSIHFGLIGIAKKTKVRTYKDNKLIEIREFHSSTTSSIENQLGSSNLVEIFINNNQAVKREIATCENEGLHKSGIIYHKTDFFDAPTFYNSENRSYKTSFTKSSEDEFNEFIKTLNSSDYISLQKKK